MKEVLIINGSGGVGKGVFVSILSTLLNGDVRQDSIVNPTKSIAKQIGWDGNKSERDRKFLSDLKLLLDDYNDMNYQYIKGLVHDFRDDTIKGKILCIDMREPKQIKMAKKDFGAKTVLVVRDSVPQIKSNVADANVFDFNYDYVIENNGTMSDLKKTTKKFLEIYLRDLIKEKRAIRTSTKPPERKFKKTIYISHPFQGKRENLEKVTKIIENLVKKFPDYLFLSPIHAFGHEYTLVDYETGINKCLSLLDQCDELWVYGDFMNSTGCLIEIAKCAEKGIPVIFDKET